MIYKLEVEWLGHVPIFKVLRNFQTVSKMIVRFLAPVAAREGLTSLNLSALITARLFFIII